MRLLAFAAALLAALSACGQHFRVAVELPCDTLSGRATLTICDGTQRRPQYSARVRQGQCWFEGRLMENQPYWAEVRHPSLATPWGFFIEAAEVIRVTPSGVSGSVSDSLHRLHCLDQMPEGLFRQGDTSLVLFSAPYCEPCKRAADSLAHLNPLLLDVEEHPEYWDRFALPHIPYLLLAAPDGTVLQRDLRWWETKRILFNYQ